MWGPGRPHPPRSPGCARAGFVCGPGACVGTVASRMSKPIANVVGFDDAPFAHAHRGDVRVVGAVCARTRLDGVLSGVVRRDGTNATDKLVELVSQSRFAEHVR